MGPEDPICNAGLLGRSSRSVHQQGFISYAPTQSSAGARTGWRYGRGQGVDGVWGGGGKSGPAGTGEGDLCASLGKGARPAKRAGKIVGRKEKTPANGCSVGGLSF